MLKKSLFVLVIGLSFSSFSAELVQAESQEVYPFEDTLHEERFASLLTELRCPKCQGSSLAGSNAPIAKDLKKEVYRLVKLGKTEEEVKNYLIDRYGNFIVYKPPFQSGTYILWLAPLLFFLITIVVIAINRSSFSRESDS
ncbi:MAG TPA: cytochrome c-type biogenesis protein [SAR86 cluster bacterium]|nr:cytochrome c-type biogenesis protein [SAR86 cluster bacterium]